MQHGGIEFTRNFGLLLDQQTFDLVVADSHAEDLFGGVSRFLGGARKLDAAGLAALASSAPAP